MLTKMNFFFYLILIKMEWNNNFFWFEQQVQHGHHQLSGDPLFSSLSSGDPYTDLFSLEDSDLKLPAGLGNSLSWDRLDFTAWWASSTGIIQKKIIQDRCVMISLLPTFFMRIFSFVFVFFSLFFLFNNPVSFNN